MIMKILTKSEFSVIKKLKKKYDIYRVLDIKSRDELEAVEFISKDGVFRGFGKNTAKAFKSATKVLKSHHRQSA